MSYLIIIGIVWGVAGMICWAYVAGSNGHALWQSRDI
jgi:hypothetical protein